MDQYVLVNGQMLLVENVVKDQFKKIFTGKASSDIEKYQEDIKNAKSSGKLNTILRKISNAITQSRLAMDNSHTSKAYIATYGAALGSAFGAGGMAAGAIGAMAYKHNQSTKRDFKSALSKHISELKKLESEAERKKKQFEKREGK